MYPAGAVAGAVGFDFDFDIDELVEKGLQNIMIQSLDKVLNFISAVKYTMLLMLRI